jgi:hypothetical protein
MIDTLPPYDPAWDSFDGEACGECRAELPETNQTGFCSEECEARYMNAVLDDANALAKSLAEDAKLAAEWKAGGRR